MPDQIAFLPERVFTPAAMPGASYRVRFYESGTTTPKTVYTTAALSVAHPSPLLCDATGTFPAVFSPGGAIKAVITDGNEAGAITLDPVFRVPTSSSGAADITFSPTVPLPFNNVQAAIEGAAASAASGFTPFGLGVTGTNALIANLDATGTASGSYRFDNTTTGTYPTGIAAVDTGTVQIWRENAGDAIMFLQSGAADRQFTRRMAGSAWGAWREVITVNQGAAEGDSIYRGASAWTRLAKGTSGQFLKMNSGATAPEWAAGQLGAMANFNGVPVSGTYSRTGTLVTVTLTAHGMTTGHFAYLDFTSGTATDGYYQITSTGANTFTVVDAASGATSGNVTRNIWTRKSLNIASIVRQTTARYQATFATAFADADFLFIGHAGEVTNRVTESVSINALGTLPTTTTVTFYTGDTGGSGVPSSIGSDNAYIHFVVYA